MTKIRLQNTRTRRKEEFEPIDASNVRMYVCGPTVYDRAHLGNARPVVVFDVLFRLLRHVYGADHVTYVRNFTDVDDKINAKAAATGRPIRDITDETIGWYHADMDALGALRPTHEPRATEWIGAMIAMIEGLIASGHAYVAEGHVLFDVRSYPAYGALSGRSVDDMIAGARVEVAPYKRDPMDFVLWKPSEGDQPGWDSPWGFGRPGWHIECSAMSHELLGDTFDIHAGGIDLQFPHHENEIAQSCCALSDKDDPSGETKFARYWLHNEMLLVEGKKMSKSLGNFFTVRDLLDQGVPGEVIRYVMLMTHYSKPMDWTDKKAAEAFEILNLLYEVVGDIQFDEKGPIFPGVVSDLANDLNTKAVLDLLHGAAVACRITDGSRTEVQLRLIKNSANLLGLLRLTQSEWKALIARGNDLNTFAAKLTALREAAVAAKDFSAVDALKSALVAAGVEVRMSKAGVDLVPGPGFDPAKLEGLL